MKSSNLHPTFAAILAPFAPPPSTKRQAMKGDTFITFRGESDVRIEFDCDFSGPGTGVGVEWWFADRTDVDVMPEEDDAITQAVIAAAEDR